MKQHITPEQYEQLGDPAKTKLLNWCIAKSPDSKVYDEKRLTIGQLIEYLIDHGDPVKIESKDGKYFIVWNGYNDRHGWHNKMGADELTEALWVLVKVELGR